MTFLYNKAVRSEKFGLRMTIFMGQIVVVLMAGCYGIAIWKKKLMITFVLQILLLQNQTIPKQQTLYVIGSEREERLSFWLLGRKYTIQILKCSNLETHNAQMIREGKSK